jgi:hypothetical protein
MDEVALRQVRDGRRVLRFRASVLGAATSHRGSVPRWSELVVYRLPEGSYLISKIGRSTVAHRPDCLRVNRWMVTWGSAQTSDEFIGPRTPCPYCRPDVEHMPANTLLEIDRYQVFVSQNAESAAQSLLGDRAALLMPQVVADVLAQCAQKDPEFARYSAADGELKLLEKTTRTP